MRFQTLNCFVILAVIGLAGARPVVADEIETLDDIIDVTDSWYLNPQQYPIFDRAINVFAGEALRPGTMLLVFDHRVRGSLSDDPFHDFLGFDAGGLKVGIGYRYGLYDNLDMGWYRSNGTIETYDTYEFDARYQFRRQRLHNFDMAFRVGFTWFPQKDSEDASGVFYQLLTNKTINHRFRFGTGLLYHSESSNANKADTSDDYSLAIPATLEVRLSPSLSWSSEVVTTIDGYHSAHPVITSALKIITHSHTFAILVTNSQYITADGIVTGSDLDFNDAMIGFTITKELGT